MGEGETRVNFSFFMTCWNGSVCQYLVTLASDTKKDSQNLDPLSAQGWSWSFFFVHMILKTCEMDFLDDLERSEGL